MPSSSVVDVRVPRGDFVAFFMFQCERIQLGGSKRLRPSRSILKYISAIEAQLFGAMDVAAADAHSAATEGPSSASVSPAEAELTLLNSAAHGELLDVDLSSLFPGSALCVAFFRALAAYRPPTQGDGNHAEGQPPRVVLKVGTMNCTQCGLDNDAVRALCGLLTSGRCALLTSVVLDRNEYVAVEAGQIVLRALGVAGPLGDGCRGDSYGARNATTAADATPRPRTPNTPTPNDARDAAAPLTLRAALPRLTQMSFDATHVPPHFIRRVHQLLAQ